MELLGRAERMQRRNRGCAVGGRLERLQALFREGKAVRTGHAYRRGRADL